MRKLRLVGLGSVAVVLAIAASTPALSAVTANPGVQVGHWHGKTKQGYAVDLDVFQVRQRLMIEHGDVAVEARCPVSGYTIGAEVGNFKTALRKDGTFHVRYFDPFFGDVRFSGALADTDGAGTASYFSSALLKNDGLELCASPRNVGWKAHYVGSRDVHETTPRPDYLIRITVDPSGRVTWTVTTD